MSILDKCKNQISSIESELNMKPDQLVNLVKNNLHLFSTTDDPCDIEIKINKLIKKNYSDLFFNYPFDSCDNCDFYERQYNILRINCIHEHKKTLYNECEYFLQHTPADQ